MGCAARFSNQKKWGCLQGVTCLATFYDCKNLEMKS